MNGNVLGLCNGIAVNIEQRAGTIAAILDIGRIGGANERSAHLLGDCEKAVLHDFQRNGIHVIPPPFADTQRRPTIATGLLRE